MSSVMRPRLLAAAVVLLALGVGWQFLESAKGDDRPPSTDRGTAAPRTTPETTPGAAREASKSLVLGGTRPQTMQELLTAVTQDVDAYWTKTFKASGLPEPRVSYKWIPAGQTAASACGDEDGTLGDSAAAYCPGDDTIYISEKFATDIYNGTLDRALPGSSRGYGRTIGDFSVAYIVAHEYGHEVQAELGLFDEYGQQGPTMAFELQADCYAGTWAKSAYREDRLEEGDVQEALDAALAVGDFDAGNPAHHGTPEQRAEAWNSGFEAGDPAACNRYLET